MPPPRGNIHVYYHNIQISSLKPLCQFKPNFMLSIYRMGETMCIFKNNLGHITKTAAMPIYGKNL